MQATAYADQPQEYRTFTPGRKWLSENDDKAWGEKLYLWFIPVFFLLTGIASRTGLGPVDNVWNLALGFMVWLPYCVILPLILRRDHPLPFWMQWWFKFQIYMAVIVFIMSYFGTEYFFDVLGMRYDYKITWYLDSALLGPDQSTALAEHKRVPLGMYPLTMAFFTLYHAAAIVMIRRLVNLGRAHGPAAKRLAFVLGLFATAFFFAWAETMLFMSAPDQTYAWYEDTHTQLTIGSLFYAIEFLFFFSSIYQLDEHATRPPWRWPRIMIEAAAMCMGALIVQDIWTLIFGAPFA